MGFGKKKRQIREAIEKWNCHGFLGYGQGRAVAEFGQDLMGSKSACLDICTRANTCRARHHELLNQRYPQLSQLVESTARIAQLRRLNVVNEVVTAMDHAVEMQIDEAVEVKQILEKFKITTMTDHYRCGQFENIQDGLDKVPPGTNGTSKLLGRLPNGQDLLSSTASK